MESQAHKEYVQNAIDYIKREFGVSDSQIAADLGDGSMSTWDAVKNAGVNAFVPNIYFMF